MNKDDYKALKDKLCLHNPEYDEEAKKIEELQKELQKYDKRRCTNNHRSRQE